MDNPNPDKVAKVDEIAGKLEAAGTVVVTEYRGLDVPAQAMLRAAVRDAGGEFKIYKNTLTRLAAKRAGLALDEHLFGPTALAFSYPPEGSPADPVALTKVLTEFQKTNDALVIKGGVMDGAPISAEDVTALSKVLPREELLAQFAGLLQAPMSQFARLLNAMPTKFAALTQALIEKGGPAPSSGDSADEVADTAPEAGGVYATEEAAEIVADADVAVEAAAEEADAPEAAEAQAAPEDAAPSESSDSDDAAASDQTEEPAVADSEETDDKED